MKVKYAHFVAERRFDFKHHNDIDIQTSRPIIYPLILTCCVNR